MYDNIGNRDFGSDVEEAGRAVANGALDPGERVVVLHRSYRVEGYDGARSVIYELVKDSSQSEGFRRKMLRVYDPGVNAALSPEVIAAVVGDIRRAVPAPHYGFAFGSHGSGWIPGSNDVPFSRAGGSPHPWADLWKVPENPLTRAFQGYNQELDVSEFIEALDDWSWDFIVLDDCFMASVEALYDMRTLADYIIASPTEIMISGFPYDRVVDAVFDDWTEEGFKHVGREFVDYYRDHGGTHPCATVAVVKTSELDALAESVRLLGLRLNEVSSTSGIQYYERLVRPGHLFYDLDDYLGKIRATTMPAEFNAYRQQLARTVIFAGHTATFFSAVGNRSNGKFIPVDSFSGLAVFIPWSQTAAFIPDYRQTEWYKYVYEGE